VLRPGLQAQPSEPLPNGTAIPVVIVGAVGRGLRTGVLKTDVPLKIISTTFKVKIKAALLPKKNSAYLFSTSFHSRLSRQYHNTCTHIMLSFGSLAQF
jgi:hypothetical protein